MATTDVEHELAQQLKVAGKLLSQPLGSDDDLLHILDETEKLLSKVDQSPNTSMVEAITPLTKTLADDGFLNHLNIDVKVAVAACLCELTRITAPDPPFEDGKLKGVCQLIVSSFEHLSDKSSRSYVKRASILDTVSKVRLCVVMLDLECEELIVEMFEHFLNSVRDHDKDNIISPMEDIMAAVFEESDEISVEILKPLLASIKNNAEGVLPVARELGEGVLKRCAAMLKPSVIKTLGILGDSLDNYSQVLASICEGTTDVVAHNDETTVQRQAVMGNAEADDTLDATLKSLGSEGGRVSGNEGGFTDKESSKKPEEAIDHPNPNPASKLDVEDSVSEKLRKVDSKKQQASKRRGNKTGTTRKSAAPDSPQAYDNNKTDKNADVLKAMESEIADVPVFDNKETDKNADVPKAMETQIADDPSDENYVKDTLAMEPKAANTGALSRSLSIPCKSRTKRTVQSKKKSTGQDDAPSMEVPSKTPEGMNDSNIKSPKRGKKKAKFAQVDKLPAAVSKEEVLTKAPEGISDSNMKAQKRARKKTTSAKEDKPPATIATVGDSIDTSDSDLKHLKTSSKKVDTINPRSNTRKKQGKKVGGKKRKLSGMKTDAADSEASESKKAGTKEEESDSDSKPLNQFTGNKEKRRRITKPSVHPANRDVGSDSDNQPLKRSSKKGVGSSSAPVKSSSKTKEGKKLKTIKKVDEKDQTKSLPEDDVMDVSSKSEVKTATEERNLEETPVTTSKRKRAKSKDKVAKTIKYDDSLVGQKVKIWWPMDKMYYEGVIESFDSAKSKHKVLYRDGEFEELNLRQEKWEIIQEYSAHYEDIPIPAEPTDEQTPKKKSKTPQENPKAASKRCGKSKGQASKSSDGSKGKGKVSIESKSQKDGCKSDSSKDAGISEDDDDDVQLSKLIPKKLESPKIVYKSKGKIKAEKAKKAESIEPKSTSGDVEKSEDAEAAGSKSAMKGKKSA